MVSEAVNVDIETVTSSDSDEPEDFWLEQLSRLLDNLSRILRIRC